MIYNFFNNIKKNLAKFLKSHYFVLLLLIFPSIIWIFLDNHVWPWDQALYGEISIELYYKLVRSFSDWWPLMMHAFGTKAPAIAWFGQFFVPLSHIVGTIDRALMMQIVVAQFLSLIFIYKIVLSLTNKNKNLALLGSLIMASAPLFVGMGHQYLVESLQLFIVTFIIYIFINIGIWSKYDSIIAFTIALTYAMLVKVTSPLYVLLVMVLGFVYLIKMPKKISIREYFKKKNNIILYILGLTFLVIAFSWYVINFNSIFQFMKLASSGSAAELYGSKASFLIKFESWLMFFQKSFFVTIIACSAYFLLGFFSIKYIFKSRQKITINSPIVTILISLGSIIFTLVLFSFQINEETRYLLPLLPYIVIIICLTLNEIKSKSLIVFFALTFLAQYFFINGVALEIVKNTSQEISIWVKEKHSNKDDLKNIKVIIVQTCKLENANKYNIVGVEFPFLNANSVNYYATQQKLKTNFQCYYTSLGYAENNINKAISNVKNFIKPPYFITVSSDSFPATDAFNVVSIPVAESIENDKNFVEQKFPQSKSIRIFKNSIIK